MATKINPFGTSEIADYDYLYEEFGLQKISSILKDFPEAHKYLKSGLGFGHRDFDKIVEKIKKKQEFAVMSGIKPSSKIHLGGKKIMDFIIYLQGFGGKVFYAIADLEAYIVSKTSLEKIREHSIDNVIDLVALGLDLDNAYIYAQSKEQTIMNNAYIYSRLVTNNQLKAIYGDCPIGFYFSALTQVADILRPQKDKKLLTVVPVGIDQDPHIRMTRDVADKLGLIKPSGVYFRMTKSLTGSQMSSRKPETCIFLSDDPKVAAKKILAGITGGRENIEMQKKIGGQPEKCSIWETYIYLPQVDEKYIERIKTECKSGKRICGDCKKECAKLMKEFLINHQKRRKEAEPKVREYFERSKVL